MNSCLYALRTRAHTCLHRQKEIIKAKQRTIHKFNSALESTISGGKLFHTLTILCWASSVSSRRDATRICC